MRRLTLTGIGIFCLVAFARPAAAQGILPSSFAGWNASEPSAVVSTVRSSKGPSAGASTGLDQVLGSDAATLREYSLKSVERRAYLRNTQAATITLYRLRDPSSAYGAYTFLRNDSLVPVTLGSFGSASRDRALFVVGDLLVDVTATQATPTKAITKPARPPDADLKQLAGSLNKVADHTPFPSIGQHLPDHGRVLRSEHYVLGPRTLAQYVPLGTDDWIGFDYSAETILARYRLGDKDVTLLIASYPTQQIAAAKFSRMLRRFVFDPPGTVPANQTVLFGKRVSALVAIVIGAPSREAANSLLDQIQYETQVTWNEPKQTITEPSFNSMIVGAFMGTGAIMVLAVVAGIGFGGIRLLFKIFLPNKVFDREKQVEILQLGLSSKPINAKDFY
jgi:hypothetical protein